MNFRVEQIEAHGDTFTLRMSIGEPGPDGAILHLRTDLTMSRAKPGGHVEAVLRQLYPGDVVNLPRLLDDIDAARARDAGRVQTGAGAYRNAD